MDEVWQGLAWELGQLGAGALVLLGVVLWARAVGRRLAAQDARLTRHEQQSTADRGALHAGQDSLREQLVHLQATTDAQSGVLAELAPLVRQLNSDARTREIAAQVVAALQTGRGQQLTIGELRAARDAHLSTEQGGRE